MKTVENILRETFERYCTVDVFIILCYYIIIRIREGENMLEYKYDTQLLIDGENLDEDIINEYFISNFKGDCLLAVGDEDLIKIHFHTNEPWKVLEYCASLGEIYDIVVEDMDRQERGLKG